MREIMKDWCLHSLTILWARLVACAGLLMIALETLTQDAAVSQAIQSMLHPKYVPYYVVAIGLVTELARRRSLDRG